MLRRQNVDSLPHELILLILVTADKYRDTDNSPHACTRTYVQPMLENAALLNRTWNAIATKFLYKRICLSSSNALSSLAETLMKKKHLREHVRSIFFTRFFHESGETRLSYANWRDLEKIHKLCPHLCSATIKRGDTPSTGMFKRTRLPSSHPLVNGSIMGHMLTRLELEALPPNSEEFLSPAIQLPMLQELILKRFRSVDVEGTEGLKLPSMPALQRLCFRGCHFWGGRMPFPTNSPNLRILEIEGGACMTGLFWQNLVPLADKLESFTLSPYHITRWPLDGDMTFFSSLVDLRISFCDCFNDPYETTFPSTLRYLVIEHICPFLFASSLPSLETMIAKILDMKAMRLAYERLDTVTIHTKTHYSFQWDRVGLAEKADQADVKLLLHFHDPNVASRVNSVFRRFSPMF